jgi:hypothetical protein
MSQIAAGYRPNAQQILPGMADAEVSIGHVPGEVDGGHAVAMATKIKRKHRGDEASPSTPVP